MRSTGVSEEHTFLAEAAIPVGVSRQVAREFAKTPGRKPRATSWRLEGAGNP